MTGEPRTHAIEDGLDELAGLATLVAREMAGEVAAVASRVEETLRKGGTLLFCGNGGSAADAQHLAAEYVVRFRRERRGLRAVALTTDTSILTAASNDLGFRRVFARQVEALGREGDLLVLHSTSGESENLVEAARAARHAGVGTVAFLARGGGTLRGEVDHAVVVPTDSTARAQELHLALGHLVCDAVEAALADGRGTAAPSDGPAPEDAAPAVEEVLSLLEESRVREKGQTLFYRVLAAEAVASGFDDEAERLNELHADEQHHFSRLTARVLELGGRPGDVRPPRPEVGLEGWETVARDREEAEVAWYRELLTRELDDDTRAVVREILESELHHRTELRGKWMSA